ncbi:MAG: hypothetical protein AB7S74_17440 [Hyphomicrobium sp.]
MRNDLKDHECNAYCRTPFEECLVQLLLTGSIITPKTDVLLSCLSVDANESEHWRIEAEAVTTVGRVMDGITQWLEEFTGKPCIGFDFLHAQPLLKNFIGRLTLVELSGYLVRHDEDACLLVLPCRKESLERAFKIDLISRDEFQESIGVTPEEYFSCAELN